MSDPASDLVWNRAPDRDQGPGTPPGDAALAGLLLCHGMAGNGGLLHVADLVVSMRPEDYAPL